MKSARERMDMNAAYPRGGLLSSGGRHLRHHRQDRQAGRGQGPGRRGGLAAPRWPSPTTTTTWAPSSPSGWNGPTGGSRPSGCCPVVRAAGYAGSARNLRRAVAEAKAKWRVDHHRGRRPGVWAPGDVLVFDWGEIGPLFVFCAVLAWSRFRFVLLRRQPRGAEHHGGVGRVHGDDRRGAQDPPHRSHGLSEGRQRGRARGPDTGLRALRHPLRDASGLL